MKANKTKLFLLIISAIAILSSCDKLNEISGVDAKLFHAQTSSTEESKTFIDNDLQIFWTEDDRLSVFQSSTNEQYRYTGKTGQPEGDFEKVGSDQPGTAYSRNYAIYPYDSNISAIEEGRFSLTLPATQYYAEYSFGLGANTMVAVTKTLDDDELLFKNACGYLMLKLYGGDKVRSIKFYGNNGEKIAGAASLTIDGDQNLNISMAESATTEIILDCGEDGVPTSTYKDSPTTFWMVVPPVDFEKGFAVEITNTAGQKTKRSTTKQLSICRNSIKQMAAIKVELQSSNDLLSFSLSDGKNTYKAFDISNGYVNVQVPNETDMTNMTATFDHNGAKVTVNDVEQTSGEGLHDFSDFVHPLTYVVTSRGGVTQSYIIRMFNLPIVFATTPNGKPITSKTVWTENCTFKIRDTDGTMTDYGSTNLKGRGNATWSWYNKKSYSIKFNNKYEVLGMPKHKRWVLLMNETGYYYSNIIGFELSKRTESIEWTPSLSYVELFINGIYMGLYTIVEQIKVDKNRVNITEMSSTDVEGDAITGGYLLSYDTTFDEPNKFRSQYFNMPVMIMNPDEDVLISEQFNYIQEYVNNFEASLANKERFNAREYARYFDIDSYIDVWFVWEMAGDTPCYAEGNIDFIKPKSVWFYKDRNKVMKSGPVWDFNQMLFYRQRIFCTRCQYYGQLFKSPYFVQRVKDKWPYFKRIVESEDSKSGSIVSFLDDVHNTIDKASKRDWDMWWKNGHSAFKYLDTPDEQYQLIHDGIYPKLDFLESYINSLVVDYDTLPGTNEDVNSQQDETDNFNFGF